MRDTIRYDAVVTLLSSVAHAGDVLGTVAEFHREKVMLPDETVELIPTITGNSIRGQLRDCAATHMLRTLGMGEREDGSIDGLPLGAFYFLFSGGSLSKSGLGTLDIQRARELAELVPMVSLFGGAAGNYIMPGRLKVGKLIPIAAETAHLVPSEFCTDGLPSVWDMMQIESYTRKDDAKDDRLVEYLEYLEPGERLVTVPDESTPQQMRYEVETMAANARLYWYVLLDHVTALEQAVFLAALAEWGKQATLGGKSAVGHGRALVDFGGVLPSIDPRVGSGPKVPEIYETHLVENRERIREVLHGL